MSINPSPPHGMPYRELIFGNPPAGCCCSYHGKGTWDRPGRSSKAGQEHECRLPPLWMAPIRVFSRCTHVLTKTTVWLGSISVQSLGSIEHGVDLDLALIVPWLFAVLACSWQALGLQYFERNLDLGSISIIQCNHYTVGFLQALLV